MFDTKQQNCAFAGQTGDFIYGELNAESKIAFEAHAQNCAGCAEEIAGFGAVRASIADWRSLEFDLLPTPTFKIGYEQNNQSQTAAAVSAKTESWLDGLSKIFTQSPAFASVAMLFLAAICAGLIAYNFGGGQQTADVANHENRPQTNASTDEKSINQAAVSESDVDKNEQQVAAEKSPELNKADDKNTSPQNARKNITARAIVKISNGASDAKKETNARRNYNSPTNRKVSDSNTIVAQNNLPTNKRSVPKLSSIEDDEDEASLRLTDLLDDAGGK